MGFMGIHSIGASDNTSDNMSVVAEAIYNAIHTFNYDNDNQFNTPGYIDAALILRSLISSDNEYHFVGGDWNTMWTDLLSVYDENADVWGRSDMADDYAELYNFVRTMKQKSDEYGI